MKPHVIRCWDRLRVRWSEVDMQQVVFNGHFLTYADTAMGAYWRQMALPYQEAMALLGGDLVVRKSVVEHEASARYDDVLTLGVRNERIGRSSIEFSVLVQRSHQVLARVALTYVFADSKVRQAISVPDALLQMLRAFEAGDVMVDVEVGSWDRLGEQAQSIRTEVFVDEQGIPPEMEWDAEDAHCVHAVARNRLGMPLGTGRLLEHVPGVAKIGRMAVRRAVRGSQVGRAVLDALMGAARQRGDHEVVLHAQTSAENFYNRAGFRARGPVFEEAGIAHIEMVCSLR